MDIITNKQGLLRWFLLLLWTSGQTDGSDVIQTSILWENKGVNATMSCRHTKGAQYFQMYWYRQLPGETMQLVVFTTIGTKYDFGDFSRDKFSATKPDAESGTFTVKNLQPEDKGLYFCAVRGTATYTDPAYFGQGTKLTVLEPGLETTKPTVKVLPPSPKEYKSPIDDTKKKTIVCVASGFYPDHVGVKWYIDGENVTDGVATDSAALREDKYYKITSRLRVSAKDWFTLDKEFTCKVSFFDGTDTEDYEDSIYGVKAKEGVMTREKYLRITQTAKLSYSIVIIKSSIYGAFVAFLVWKLQRSARKQND